jgi:hypothetical protein
MAVMVSVIAAIALAGCSRSTGTIEATGKVASVADSAGGSLVCVTDEHHVGVQVCGVVRKLGLAEPPRVGMCARIVVTRRNFDLRFGDC